MRIKRRPIPTGQRIVGLLALIGLGVMAIWVWQKQFQFNPAVLVGERLAGPAGLEPPTPAQPRTQAELRLVDLPEAVPWSSPESFTAETLADKIDGKAELYLASGFNKLASQRFRIGPDQDSWLEMFVYEMAGSRPAFAVYSSQRRARATPVAGQPWAYQTANALYWLHGRYYLELVAARASVEASAIMIHLARNWTDRIQVQADPLAELSLFPSDGLRVGSQRLTMSNGFGFDRLTELFTADYDDSRSGATVFISRRADRAEAEKTANDYADFLLAYGGVEKKVDLGLPGVRLIEVAGASELIFTRGPFLAGVHQAESLAPARDLALALAARLQEAGS